jgi:Protein of unknown function (DUF2510)
VAAPGWYPDPAGPAGSFRWWDGSAWTGEVRSATAPGPGPGPAGAPAAGAGAPVADATPAPATQPVPAPPGGVVSPGAPPPGGLPPFAAQFGTPPPPPLPPPSSRRRLPLIIGAAAAVVLLAAAAVFLATRGGDDAERASETTETDSTTEPDETTTTDDSSTTSIDEQPPAPGGRISSGALSYQALGGNWQPFDNSVSAMPDATGQMHVTQEETPAGGSFIASVVIGSVTSDVAYGGPDDLEPAALALAQLLVTASGAYPDGTTGEVTAAEPAQVDGHPAFVVRVELVYDIEGLNATGETVRIAVIDTPQGPAAFWGSVPNDAPQLVPDMEAAFASLTVDE